MEIAIGASVVLFINCINPYLNYA